MRVRHCMHNACNVHSPLPLPLRINAIVDDHVAVAVFVIFAKLPIVFLGPVV